MEKENLFKWKHYQLDIILLTVRWYLRYNLSFRDLVEMRWYSKTGTQYRDKLFYIRGVSDEKTV